MIPVSTVTSYELDDRGFESRQGQEISYPNVQFGYGAHQAS